MKLTKVGFTVFGALLALAWIASLKSGTTAADSEVGQTGPPPTVIDAAEYPNLQAAFDAVPVRR